MLDAFLSRQYGGDCSLVQAEAKLLKTVPQRGSSVTAYRLKPTSADAVTRPLTLIAKRFVSYSRAVMESESMRVLGGHGFSPEAADGVHVPRPYALVEGTPVCFMEYVPGARIRSLLAARPDPALVRLLALVLAKLHSCGADFPATSYFQRRMQRLDEAVQDAADGSGLRAAYERILALASTLPLAQSEALGLPVHGDYHAGQVHFEAGHAWLLDTGLTRAADPSFDIGGLLGSLQRLDRGVSLPASFEELILDEYERVMPLPAGWRQRAHFYAATSHLLRAARPETVPSEREAVLGMAAHHLRAAEG